MLGQTVSHYKILEKLGKGGMGIVYKARDTKLERNVALKFLPPHLIASKKERERLIREAKAVAALNHPNICTIHDVDEHNGRQYIVMEYIEGKTLQQKMKDQRLEADSVIAYSVQIVKALEEAHSKGIIHRDIKPGNIMVMPDDRIKIMDFGLAKLKGTARETTTGKTAGTISYMSPEQVRGEDVDRRSDIWAFGIVLYEILTGIVPFKEDYEHAAMYSILNEDPHPLDDTMYSAPPELEKIVLQCIAKNPSERYQNTADLLEELAVLEESVKSGLTDRIEGRSKNKRETKKRAAINGAVIVSIGVFIIALFAYNNSIQNSVFEGINVGSVKLAVLPLKNIGDDPSRQIFCDGLSETITSSLTHIEQYNEDLWVTPASEVRQHGITSPSEAHRVLGVNYVVTGSLQPMGDQLRLIITLVDVRDARNSRQRSSSQIDENASNIPALHERSVEDVLSMLNVEFRSESRDVMKASQTANSPAFEEYLNGIGYLRRFDKTENIELAIHSFKKSIELDPEYALAHAGLGRANWRKYDYTRDTKWLERANEEARAAIDINSELAQVNITMGMINAEFGRYEESIENFNNVLAADPTNADAYRELSLAYESQGNFDQAVSTIKRSIQLKPDYWSGHNRLGAIYLETNRYQDAIGKFEKVIELTPDNYIGYMNLGTAYFYLNRLDDAQEMYEKSLELEETFDASNNLATLYYINGRYKDAARMFETSLEISDGDYRLWGGLGIAYYWAEGEREKARAVFDRAIELAEKQKEINPNDHYTLADLAGYLAKTEDEERARNNLQKALELAPENTWVMFSAGTTYEQLGNREEALYWIKKAIEHGHSKSEIMSQPDLQDLISDERFQDFVESRGL